MTIFVELFDDAKFIFQYRSRVMAHQKGLDKLAPKAGDPAPDFRLFDVSGARAITLSDFRGKKPVALVFGSFT